MKTINLTNAESAFLIRHIDNIIRENNEAIEEYHYEIDNIYWETDSVKKWQKQQIKNNEACNNKLLNIKNKLRPVVGQ